MKYTLAFHYPDSPSITARKTFKKHGHALKWRKLCEEICGRNQHGTMFNKSIMSVSGARQRRK